MKSKILLSILTLIILITSCKEETKPTIIESTIPKVLVFSKTAGYRHKSIETGVEAIKKLGAENGFEVNHTEDSRDFTEAKLKKYAAIIWLSTTMDVLNRVEQAEFERYIQAGGGYVGIHAAADTEYDWPWYGELVGGYFDGHPNNPNVRSAELELIDSTHISTKMLPKRWLRSDEWYNYKNLNPKVHPLLKIDESTYKGGTNGDYHPMAWYHEFDGGRAWYTAGGHTKESFSEDLFLKHILGGIQYAIGENKPLDYSKAKTVSIPQENRFQMTVLASVFDEPMEMDVLPDGSVLFVERKGAIKKYDVNKEKVILIDTLTVFSEFENGLLGLALDPNYEENHWIYLFYSPMEKDKQHVSRFVFKNNKLDKKSEKIVLKISHQRETCCHSAGSLEFDDEGNLYISVGDDTNPFKSSGFGPIDERSGRKPFDAQRSSANSNDLRGKILRIKPLADGTYAIPKGNLFPEGTPDTRPEIYVMGCRNPFRISVDSRNKFLYWGDVGPDAGKDKSSRGSRGYDEVNQARQAGYFGWPYFIGNNRPYRDFNFSTGKSGSLFDANQPINNSRNNTGIKKLPPAQEAFIWYPYVPSDTFPLTKKGGRNAMAGPVYHYDDYENASNRFPKYYDGKLFIYDWMRGWINAVTMDENGDYKSMEAFLPSQKFNNPVDMVMDKKNGALYIIEYGTKWFAQNDDTRLIRIDYIDGNRNPKIELAASKTKGAVPFTVEFSAEGTEDYDRHDLSYEWTFIGKKVQSTDKNPTFTFDKMGTYKVQLKVTDEEGGISTAFVDIEVGNDAPEVAWNINTNKMFYFDNQVIDYVVNVNDKEDGTLGNGIDESQVVVTIDYLKEGFDQAEIAQGHQAILTNVKTREGKKLINESDCKACHKINEKSAGPSYQQINKKYDNNEKNITQLAEKIINGGGGVWGETQMAAHPQITEKQAKAMVRYILSLNEPAKSYQPKGKFIVKEHLTTGTTGNYVFTATYTDKGANKLSPVVSQDVLVLRHPKYLFKDADKQSSGVLMNKLYKNDKKAIQVPQSKEYHWMKDLVDGEYLMFEDIDLTDISQLLLHVPVPAWYFKGGFLEVRVGSTHGELLARKELRVGQIKPFTLKLKPTTGKNDVYFVFKNDKDAEHQVAGAISVTFLR
ncbi:MAG: ThuA domain-containing protein [Saprospiraceae bacterium]